MKTKGMDQHQVVAGLKSLDAEAIDELVHTYSRPLFGVILNYTRNPSDAEEILQDTLLKIIRKIDSFRKESNLWPWMKRIAVNHSIMWLRKHRTALQREVLFEDFMPHFGDDGHHQVPTFDWAVDPEEVLLNKELGGLLYDAIHALPFDYRAPLVLRDIEGYSIREISSMLGLKEPTTKTRIHRARLFIREKLGRYFEGAS